MVVGHYGTAARYRRGLGLRLQAIASQAVEAQDYLDALGDDLGADGVLDPVLDLLSDIEDDHRAAVDYADKLVMLGPTTAAADGTRDVEGSGKTNTPTE